MDRHDHDRELPRCLPIQQSLRSPQRNAPGSSSSGAGAPLSSPMQQALPRNVRALVDEAEEIIKPARRKFEWSLTSELGDVVEMSALEARALLTEKRYSVGCGTGKTWNCAGGGKCERMMRTRVSNVTTGHVVIEDNGREHDHSHPKAALGITAATRNFLMEGWIAGARTEKRLVFWMKKEWLSRRV